MKNGLISFHCLTAYPPSNPNRDELGQPKTAVVAGVTRQRISSQSIKRAWRLSTPMQEIDAQNAVRTRTLCPELKSALIALGRGEEEAQTWAEEIAGAFGKIKKGKHAEMVVYDRAEWDASFKYAEQCHENGTPPTKEGAEDLRRQTVSIDCALFGRMRANAPDLNRDAAVAVSHPLSVNKALIEADFWTSVDDLSREGDSADSGSGGMGDVEFGSALYYTFAQLSFDSLVGNLTLAGLREEAQAKALAPAVVDALVAAIATATPSGHRTTFGNVVRASYLRVEFGESSGNLFCQAYEKPINGTQAAIDALRVAADQQARAYGLEQKVLELAVPEGAGSLQKIREGIKTVLAAYNG